MNGTKNDVGQESEESTNPTPLAILQLQLMHPSTVGRRGGNLKKKFSLVPSRHHEGCCDSHSFVSGIGFRLCTNSVVWSAMYVESEWRWNNVAEPCVENNVVWVVDLR